MFDYLDYKNKIPLEKCLIEIPRINPLSVNYERFWFHIVKRKQIEGHWVEHNNEWKWLPGTIFQYVNLWNIERGKKGSSAKGKIIGKPDLRDIEWIKGYVHAVCRGFSGFKDDLEYSCHRILLDLNKDELLPYLDNRIKESLYNPNGGLKKYKPALQYLYEYKTSNLGKPLFYNSAKNVVDIECRNIGKDLEENTLIFYKDRCQPIKDVKIGDKIYDHSGKLTTVLERYDFNNQVQYKITLQDGRSIECGEGHLWSVYERGVFKTIETKDIIKKGVFYSKKGDFRYRIPLTAPLIYDEKNLNIDPYYLGLWLGDGNSKDCGITSIDDEILDYCKEYVKNFNLKLKLDRKYHYRITGKNGNKSNELLNKLRDFNLLHNKHIPVEYFTASFNQRLSLLQGLIDTDGSVYKNGYTEFCNTNEQLIKDVQKLCWSLGIRCSLNQKETSWTYKNEKKYSTAYRLHINTSLNICRLKRKLNRIKPPSSKKAYTSQTTVAISSIEKLEIKNSVCIKVSNKHQLFLAGDYIVTHNSVSSGNFCGHNFLTDGVMDYDEWWANKQLSKDERQVYTTQTLIGAIDSKYINNLNKHLKIGLENLPGKMQIGNTLYPAPLSKKVSGSWVVGKDVIARYEEKIGGKWEVKGSGSGFLNRSFKDNPFAANSSRYGFGLIDEVGFMGNLEDVLGQLHECTTIAGEKYGSIWMTGTGGDMVGGATESVKKVFYDPAAFDCVEFDDVFEGKGTIGFFVPAWMALDKYRDELGNINKELALRDLLKEREVARNAKSKKPLYDLLQMKPLVPSEAFLVLEGNIFPVAELKEHLANLESTERKKDLGTTGWMIRDESGKAAFKVNHDLVAADYPTKQSINPQGAVVIWEQPEASGYGQYVGGIDPYDQDAAESSVSYGSIFIYKRFIIGNTTYKLPVAEYTGRPEFANDFYEQCRRLLEYYNCQALYENQNPGLKKYFETKFCTHLLHTQPNIIKNISPSSKVNRTYGIHMTQQIKDELEIMCRDWLKEELEPGVLQLTKICSIPLLKELIAYNRDGNFDRVIAFMICILQEIEMHKITMSEAKEESTADNFFNLKLFR